MCGGEYHFTYAHNISEFLSHLCGGEYVDSS
ncbi:hypothetical protein BAZOLSSOX_1335 [uncultured Gammaproteobacteria bacterium]|nr:hypothetical protein BAZOLSSOX_1335 [uncultured Gammaproteobacteria bacterium]